MPHRLRPPAQHRGRSAPWTRAVGAGLLLACASAPAAVAATGSRGAERPLRHGLHRYQQAMNSFLAGDLKAAKRDLERVLLDHPETLAGLEVGDRIKVAHGERVSIDVGRKTMPYLPHYYLAICRCRLAGREEGMKSIRVVEGWVVSYPELNDYLDDCLIPTCGEARRHGWLRSLFDKCARAPTLANEAPKAGQVSSRSPTAGTALSSPATPGAAQW